MLENYNPFEKMRKPNTRGYFPVASAEEIFSIVEQARAQGEPDYFAIQKFLDTEPKKCLSEDLDYVLREKMGIKVGDEYVR